MLIALTLGGVIAGLWLLARGLTGYRTATRLSDTSTSPVASMAAGEVRIAGTIEPAEVTLLSPLQSVACVYYRSRIRGPEDSLSADSDFFEERAIGFRVRDARGDTVRIFPRGAHWDAPVCFSDTIGPLDDRPAGLQVRTGSAVVTAVPDREAAIAALLTVRPSAGDDVHPLLRPGGGMERRRQHYEEARLAPGDAVTIVGRAMPFADLTDPAEADVAIGHELSDDDPEIAGDIAEARAAGLLADDPEEAWGNAAIPGFGIGQPVRAPELDPAAHQPVVAATATAEQFERTFHIPSGELVLASGPGMPLLIAHGLPSVAVDRYQDRFMIGLLGAVLAIGSAMALAVVVSGGIAP